MYYNKIDVEIDHNKLLEEFNRLDLDDLLNKDPFQLAVQCRTNSKSQLYESCGSLIFDWQKYEQNPTGKLPLRTEKFKETDFTETCDLFKGTYIEYVIDTIKSKHNIVRGRFMKMMHKTCLSMHSDSSPRIHIPIYTNPGCMMIINNTIVHMPVGDVYYVDTTLPHTALNASKKDRVHLVFCLT